MVKVAVIGAGYLGKFHIEKFKKIKSAKLIGVCEIDKKIASEIEKKFEVPVVNDYRSLVSKVDAVSIVTPTPTHYEIASFFLERGVHLFIEKPVTDNVVMARNLLKKKNKNIIIQVGYVERFNPAFGILKDNINDITAIIFKRKSPFNLRGSDVDVVYDLMIHDIDLAFNLFREKPEILYAKGCKIFSNYNDLVLASVKFGKIVAIFEISRVSEIKERKIIALNESKMLEADLINQTCRIATNGQEKVYGGDKKDILLEELTDFVNVIENKGKPAVTLEDGIVSLSFAHKILKKIEK